MSGGGGGCTQFVHGCSRMTIDPGIPTTPERGTSGFHQPGRGGGRLKKSIRQSVEHPLAETTWFVFRTGTKFGAAKRIEDTYTLASLLRQDGARWVFTNQAGGGEGGSQKLDQTKHRTSTG